MRTLHKAGYLVIALSLFAILMDGDDSQAAQKKKKKKEAAESTVVLEKSESVVATTRRPAPVAANLDRLVEERLAADKIPSSANASDAEFIRRLSLDIRGRVPQGERVAKFLEDTDSQKRAKLIDEFLADPEYGEHFAIIWYHRMVKPDDDNRHLLGGNHLQQWLADHFNRNVGWDTIVSQVMTASGERNAHPATTFWFTQSDGKQGQPAPNKATAAATKLFLGVKLECCECHNHPFSSLKQTDFWTTAAFFTQTHASNSTRANLKGGGTPSLHEGGAMPKVKGKGKANKGAKKKNTAVGSIEIPFSNGKMVQATFLGSPAPVDLNGEKQLRPMLASWMTAPKNPYFARAAVNKMWANFFGRGIVNPVDDMREDGTNTHPEVLTLLAKEFAESGFDLKHLVRCICLSKTYQRTSQPLPENKADHTLYSHMPVKVMTADMLYDSLNVALGHAVGDAPSKEKGAKKKNKKKGYGGPREEFRRFFHADADDDVGVIEDYTQGIPQALRLMNAQRMNDLSNALGRAVKPNAKPEENIDRLFLDVLSRRPTDKELKRMLAYLRDEKDQGYRDILWVLLNSGEFLINH